jgi:quercetin dioxygenase-like cupin family protein
MENSPERRGEEGCTILAVRPFVDAGTNLYWHIDRFETLEAARNAAGSNGVAAEAHGSYWLMTVEDQSDDHHGGQHVASIGPVVRPATGPLTMRVQSSLLSPGSLTPVHTHSGPEVFFIAKGEQCLDMPDGGQQLKSGQTFVVPSGIVHRGRITGSTQRGALALILHDAAKPASQDLVNHPQLVLCK